MQRKAGRPLCLPRAGAKGYAERMAPEADPVSRLLADLGEAGVVRALYRAASLDVDELRSELERELGTAEVRERPTDRIDAVVDRWIRHRRLRGSVVGAGLSFAGLPGIPAALAQRFAEHLRLAQRIAWAYGIDWRTERGEILLWRGLCDALEVGVEWEGIEASPLQAVPLALVRHGDTIVVRAGRALLLRLARSALMWPLRWIPLASGGVALVDGFLEIDRTAKRLKRTYRPHHELASFDRATAQDAEIVPTS